MATPINSPVSPSVINETQELSCLVNGLGVNSSEFCNRILVTVKAALIDLKAISFRLFEQLQRKVIATPILPLTEKINRVCHDIERVFNISGCLPALGIVSGSIRTMLGRVQAIVGLAILALSEAGKFVATNTTKNKKLIKKWEELSQFGLDHLVHGTLNILRGTGEMLIGTYTVILGNTPLFIPNLINGRNFTPYYSYAQNSRY